MKLSLAVIIVLLVTAPLAWAQGPYVVGAIATDVVRTTTTKAPGSTFNSANGEAFAGALRVGTLVVPRFGLELEVHRPAAIEVDEGGGVYLAAAAVPATVRLAVADEPSAIFPAFSQRTAMRMLTIGATLFARQPVGDRVDLVYLGGVGFSRVVRDVEIGGSGPVPLAVRGLPVSASYRTRTTQYGAGPLVGIEARIAMTDHARLVTGVRLHAPSQALLDGWVLRPSVGLAWSF